MKNIVLFDEFHEFDLKPSILLDRYLSLTEKDIRGLFIEERKLISRSCPACHEEMFSSSFSKFGLMYVECLNCKTLYITPSPDDVALSDYFSSSSARRFWQKELQNITRDKRGQKIIGPRIEWMIGSIEEYMPDAEYFADVNTISRRYLEDLAHSNVCHKKTLIDPFICDFSKQDYSKFEIIDGSFLNMEIREAFDVISLFDVINRVADIDTLFKQLHRMLRDKGLCFMSANLITGFDMQVLWDKSRNLFPPDRLNAFSVEGLKSLFKRNNFECIELSTPGILDVEIVAKAIENDPEIDVPRFVKYFVLNRNSEIKKSFQEFLQSALLSSYGRILIRKH